MLQRHSETRKASRPLAKRQGRAHRHLPKRSGNCEDSENKPNFVYNVSTVWPHIAVTHFLAWPFRCPAIYLHSRSSVRESPTEEGRTIDGPQRPSSRIQEISLTTPVAR